MGPRISAFGSGNALDCSAIFSGEVFRTLGFAKPCKRNAPVASAKRLTPRCHILHRTRCCEPGDGQTCALRLWASYLELPGCTSPFDCPIMRGSIQDFQLSLCALQSALDLVG